jgi:hypothetical protein
MIMNNKTQRGGISVRSRSSSMQITNYNSVQPTDSTSQRITNDRSEMENARLTQHKRRKKIKELLEWVVKVALAKIEITIAFNQRIQLVKV